MPQRGALNHDTIVYTPIGTMNEEQHPPARWDERYRSRDTPWDRGAASPKLVAWLEDGRVPDGRILVPGCGRGHEVVELSARGFAVTAVDAAPAAIAALDSALKERGLDAELVCEDFFRWRPGRRFDAVYEQTSLCSLPPARWRDYACLLQRWIRPGGLLLALFMQTGRPGGPPWHLDPVAMQRLLAPPHWRWLTRDPDPLPHPAGGRELAAVIERGPSRDDLAAT